MYIQFGWVFGLGKIVAKVLKSFRFEPELYAEFCKVVDAGGLTITGVFERFMRCCVEADALVFADLGVPECEAEARVLVDWLGKDKYFYRSTENEEVNIQGRLLSLLRRVQDDALRQQMEDVLKTSVAEQE